MNTIKTTGEAGGMHHAFKAIMLAASQDALKSPPTAINSQAAAKAAFSLCLGILATRKRVYKLFK